MNLRLSMLIKVMVVGENDNLTNRVMVQIGEFWLGKVRNEFHWPFLNSRRD